MKNTKLKELTVREALVWSDKHRSLSNAEGVRAVHIKQLLKSAVKEARGFSFEELERATEVGYEQAVREIKEKVKPKLEIIKLNIDASQDFVHNPQSKRMISDILKTLEEK